MDAHRIGEILDGMEDWERCGVMRFGGEYGRQKGFRRKVGVNQVSTNVNVVNYLKNDSDNYVNQENQKVDGES